MKLKTNAGELSLPEDFSFEIEKNSAFFSDEGSSSVGATIPATPENLAILTHPTRPNWKSRRAELVPATLSHGIFAKSGQLFVESASKDGISVALALEDSDFYSRYADTPLKEIFAQKVLTTYSTPQAWYNWLFQVYTGDVVNDLRVIPVAVSKTGDGKYQVNNEPVSSSDATWALAHAPRTAIEGDEEINVPEGYGIAPFLLLSAFLSQLFQLCGYTVRNNCFATDDGLNRLILLHNTSDVICKGRIDYSDLVPGKTVSELLEWLRMKFHAQIICNPAATTVDIVLLEDILSGAADYDLTGQQLENLVSSFQRASRVVIRPNTSLEGSTSAAETEDDLIKKYGALVEVAEYETWPELCLVLRKATGRYYLSRAGLTSIHRTGSDGSSSGAADADLGTNFFTHDRRDTAESEEMSPDDLVPPMVFVHQVLMPYIGERRHRNTSYKESGRDEDQDFIVVEYAGRSATSGVSNIGARSGGGRRSEGQGSAAGKYFYGTTQKYDNTGTLRTGRYNITPDGIFERYFRRYDTMLRNGMVKLSGRFDIPVEVLFQWNLYALKMHHGQQLLPVKLTYEVGRQTRCLSAEFYLVKEYADGDQDQGGSFSAPVAKWVLVDTQVTAALATAQAQYPDDTLEVKYDDAYSAGEKAILMGPPLAVGLESMRFNRTVSLGYYYSPPVPGGVSGGSRTWVEKARADVQIWFESVAW